MSAQEKTRLIPFATLGDLKVKLGVAREESQAITAPWDFSVPAGSHALELAQDRSTPLDILLEAAGIFSDSEADTLVSLDEQGEETGEFAVYRNSFLSRYGPNREGDRSRCFPFVARRREAPFGKGEQAEEAESHRDRIGDRLMDPERVDPEMRHLIEDDIRRVSRVLALPFGKRVLDVGCSDGTVTFMVAERWGCEEVIGVDIAASAVEEARAKARKKKLAQRVKFFGSFIEDLDYPDHAFDTVSATETLEHVAPGHFTSCLQNLVRMVRPTGNFIVTVPNRYPDPSYVAQRRDRWRWPAHHHFFGRFKLFYLLSRFFARVEFFPHDDACPPGRGIYLICCCWGKKERDGSG